MSERRRVVVYVEYIDCMAAASIQTEHFRRHGVHPGLWHFLSDWDKVILACNV